MPTARAGLGVGVVSGVLYAVGGDDGRFALATVEAYDPATNTWTHEGADADRADWSRGWGGERRALCFRGIRSPSRRWRPTTHPPITWSTKEPMPTARYGLGVGVANGVLYAVGGSYVSGGVGSLFAIMEGYYNAPPRAANVAIVGTPSVGHMLTGTYVYVDDEGESEGTSTYRWLRDGSLLAGATTTTYSVGSADLGRSLTFEVTPRAQSRAELGSSTTSAPVVIVASAPSVTITTPTSEPTATVTRPFLTLGGTAAGNAPGILSPAAGGVTQVTWMTDPGTSGTATGTEDWQAGSAASGRDERRYRHRHRCLRGERHRQAHGGRSELHLLPSRRRDGALLRFWSWHSPTRTPWPLPSRLSSSRPTARAEATRWRWGHSRAGRSSWTACGGSIARRRRPS